jgi:CRP-like cAMP-binding protein
MDKNELKRLILRNRFLAKLPTEEFDRLLPNLELVSLNQGDELIRPDEPISFVYFPIDLLASLVITMEDGSTVESGSVGREGLVGIPALLGARSTPMETVVQIPGQTSRISVEAVRAELYRDQYLHGLFLRYVHTLFIVASQSAACNRLHPLEKRLCRWLLMSSDGVDSLRVPLTHEFLGTMLGTRRAGVTEAALKLQQEGFITYTRGVVDILDRNGLERACCECFRVVKAEFEKFLGSELGAGVTRSL